MRMWFVAAAESGPSDRLRGRDGSLWDVRARCAKIRDVKMTDEFLYLDMTPEGLRWQREGPGSRSSFPGRRVVSVSQCRCGDVNDNWSCLWLAEVLWPSTPDPPWCHVWAVFPYSNMVNTSLFLRLERPSYEVMQLEFEVDNVINLVPTQTLHWNVEYPAGVPTASRQVEKVSHLYISNTDIQGIVPLAEVRGGSSVISVNADINGKLHRSGRSNAAG